MPSWSIVPTLSMTLILICSLLTLLWIVSVYCEDASIIDPMWGTGFVIVSWSAFYWNQPNSWRHLLIASLTTIWGLRLSIFLLWRNWGHGEDRRYAAMRAHHGGRFKWISLLTVFLLQAVILWLVSMPIQVAMTSTKRSEFSLLDAVGLAMWLIGFLFESIGDWQLASFKADAKNVGRVMDRGLWSYTRHPNYFGDFCVWWGIYFVAGSSDAWWTIGSPLLMAILLMKVSGVTLLESSIIDRRPEYADYQWRTNAFFPGPQKRSTLQAAPQTQSNQAGS